MSQLAKFKHIIIFTLVFIMMISIASPAAEAAAKNEGSTGNDTPSGESLKYQGGNSLTGGHTYSDLYASYIFSKSDSDVASEVNGTMSDISKYPTDSEDTGTGENDNQAYGQMTGPFSNRDSLKKDVGKQTATYINTLYKYDYVVPAPRNSDEKSVLSVFGNLIAGNSASLSRSADSFITKKSLDTASMGASIFDFFSSATDKFSKMARNLDVTRLIYNTNPPDGDKDDGFIQSTVKNVLSTAGLTADNIKVFQYFAYTLILVSGVIALIVAFNSKNVKQKSGSAFKRNGLRILVIILFLPTVYALNGVFDSLDDGLTSKSKTSANDFNEQFVVDSLMFAATTNLNLGIANPNGEISPKDNYAADQDFKPSGKRVKALMDDVNSRAKRAGINDNDASAKSLISQISNQKKVDVNDYFGLISQGSDAGASDIAASTTPLFDNIDAGYTTGKAFSKDRNVKIEGGSGNLRRNPIFLSQNKNAEDKFNSTMDKPKYKNADTAKKGKKQVYYIPPDKKVGGEGKDKNKSLREKASEDLSYSLSYKMITRSNVPVAQNMPFNLNNARPEEPGTYIYGATPPGGLTKANKEFANYTNGSSGIQNHNPVSGKEKVDDKQLQESMKVNALRIALMNRYGGISSKPGVSTNSLSTQSTAFLLQTENPKAGVLNYKGFNPVASEEGESKQTGKDGNGFVRYVIPNTGKVDLITKVGSINVTWLTSGVIAAAAFIYLLMSPVFGALLKQFKFAFATGFTGNFAALFSYITYRVGLTCSFLFAKAAVMMGVYFSTYLVSSFDIIGQIFGAKNFVPGSAASISTLVFALALCLILLWPVAKISIGQSGKQKSVSVLGILIIIPYMICQNLEEFYDRLYARVYGKSQRNSFIKDSTRGARRIKQGQMLKNGGGKLAKGAATVGIGAATGGTSLMAAGGKAALSHGAKHLGKGLGSLGNDQQGDELGPGIDIGKDGKKGNGFFTRISSLGQTMENYGTNQLKANNGKKSIEKDPYDVEAHELADQTDKLKKESLENDSFQGKDNNLQQHASQHLGKDAEVITDEDYGDAINHDKDFRFEDSPHDNMEDINDPQMNNVQNQDGLDKKIGVEKDGNVQDVNVVNPQELNVDENGVISNNDNSNNDDNADRPLHAKLDNEDDTQSPEDINLNDNQGNILPEGVTLDKDGNAVDEDGNKVELNDDQKVALEDSKIGLDGQGVDLNNDNVNLNDTDGVNLKDGQNVDLNNDNVNLDDKEVNLNDQGVNLNDTDGVNLKDGQNVNLDDKEVNLNDQGVNLNDGQNVDLNNDGVNLNDGQGVNLNNDTVKAEPTGNQNVKAELKDGQSVKAEPTGNQNVKAELKDGQTVKADTNGNVVKTEQSGNNGTSNAQLDDKSIDSVLSRLKDAGIKSTPDSAVLEKLANNSSFNKAAHIKEAATQKVELKQNELNSITDKLDKLSLENAQKGIQNSDNQAYKDLSNQMKSLEREIGHQSQRAAGAKSMMKSEAREIKRERVIERTKETYNNVKETKTYQGAKQMSDGVKDIVKGNDNENTGSKGRNLGSKDNEGKTLQDRRRDRQNDEIIRNLRAIRDSNSRNGRND